MSANKKNNKKNRRNNYKIEALEPRLMMDATIASWENEASSFSVLPTTNVINWLNETFQNVSKVDSSTGSKSSLQVKEVLESEIDVADYGDIKEEIKTQFKDAVDDFREEKVSEYKAAHSGVSDKEAENAVAGQSFKASDIVAKMSRFKVNDWSISFKADGSNPDVIIFTVSKNGTRTIKDDLDAFVARDSNINVNLECQTKDNVVYSAGVIHYEDHDVYRWFPSVIKEPYSQRIQEMKVYQQMTHINVRNLNKINSIYIITNPNEEYRELFKLDYVNHTDFDRYSPNSKCFTYTHKSEGEWLIEFKPLLERQPYRMKLNYNEGFDIDLDSDLYIPDNYIELLIVALAHKLAIQYPRLDEAQMVRLQNEVAVLVDNVRTPAASDRMLQREDYFSGPRRMSQTELMNGDWLFI